MKYLAQDRYESGVKWKSGAMDQEIAELKQQLARLQSSVAAASSQPAAQFSSQVVPSPQIFSFNKEDWIDWISHYERYRVAVQLDSTDEKNQINNLLLFMGPKITKLLSTNQKRETEFRSYEELKNFLNGYFVGTRNIVYTRAKFNLRDQKEGEPAERYIGELISLAKTCDFKNLEDELVRDRLVVGIRDSKLSEALQMDSSLTLQKAIEKITQSERIKEENKELRSPETVSQVAKKKYPKKREDSKVYDLEKPSENKIENSKNNSCSRCGKKPAHPRNKCPADNVRCRKCRIVGHFAAHCRTKKVSEVVDEEDLSSSEQSSEETVGEIINICQIKENKPWMVKLRVGEKKIRFKVDTGADETVLSKIDYERYLKMLYPLEKTRVRLVGPGNSENSELKVFGQVHIPVTIFNSVKKIKCYVVETKENLLGRPALRELDLVVWKNKRLKCHIRQVKTATENDSNESDKNTKIETVVSKLYPNLFSGLGKLKKFKHKICLSENVKPYACLTPRRVPLPLQKQVEKELDRMVKEGVIEKIDEATEWCSPMVIVPKKDSGVRVCSDFTELNKFVVRERYQLPSVEETLAKLKDAKIFTKLDFNSGFWQLSLDKESRKYTTFLTPFGRFAYKRVPFGISSAPEVFQKTISDLIKTINMDCVLVHADDILVTGHNIAEHENNLKKVLKLLSDSGLTLNKNKCEFEKTETKYLGYLVSSNGIKIDPKSSEAIIQYPLPKNKTEVRRFLGLVNYVSKFVKNLAEKTQSIRELLRNDNQFLWTEKHQSDFHALKLELASRPVLAKFSTSRQTRISADSSQYGLGAVLEQLHENDIWRPVYYCSKSLSDSEKKYAQIEKEALAVTWACERLEQFILGSRFEIFTDHKPLTVILATKEINKLSNRLQRFRMRLLKFNYTITYVPGKTFFVPDALSRAPVPEGTKDCDIIYSDSTVYVNAVLSEIANEMLTSTSIREKQLLDDQLVQVKQYVMEGWPDKKKLKTGTQEFYKFREHLAINDDFLCYGDRLVIPASLRRQCLARIHDGHFGLNRCIARAKETIWWPSLNSQIENLVHSCEICVKNRSPHVEPMLSSEIPSRPWSTIGVDLAEYQGRMYLVVQDYYSKFPEIKKLKRITSESVIKALKTMFSRHGIPSVLRSDNGTQFTSYEFKEFARDYGFKWISSSPEYQQSNGQAESAVKLLKRILKRNPEDIDLALLTYRNTVMNCGASPAQLMFGRTLRDRVPILEKRLLPRMPDHQEVRRKMENEKEKQKRDYDKRHRTKENEELNEGDRVWITNMQKEGKVNDKTEMPRSYIIETDEGGSVRRNRRHLQRLPDDGDENKSPGGASVESPTKPEEESARPKRNIRKPVYLNDFITD